MSFLKPECEYQVLCWQVASDNISVSIGALKQLDRVLKDPSKNLLLKGCVNQLLQSIIIQFDLVNSTINLNPNPEIGSEEVVLLCQNVCITLSSLLDCEHLIKEATECRLRGIFFNLTLLDSDPYLMQINFDLIKPTLFKLVERSDHTKCVTILVELLEFCTGTQETVEFTELVIKCLWQFEQLLPSVIDQVDLSRMLMAIDKFFVLSRILHFQDQPSDTPKRILKSLLHTVVKLVGNEVLNHTDLIMHFRYAEVLAYLHKFTDVVRPSG